MEDTLRMLIAEHESRRMRQRMAWEARLERAQADPQAVVWAEREADRLAKYLEDRQAGGR
ncbi:hypothetical protein JK358_24145 [Nocardia sp. 2]|uniref:Uncharacterized protein n=1 Tax=Nocardia acididurans TaxID=2802282 RepID=A0ABS1MAB6_9NOCA|nr:hypothetical protein [Nocardia acididurans]MBL1077501.1 hypothetical protein [Nocardia acididurans]